MHHPVLQGIVQPHKNRSIPGRRQDAFKIAPAIEPLSVPTSANVMEDLRLKTAGKRSPHRGHVVVQGGLVDVP
jgi:hypothetical protein